MLPRTINIGPLTIHLYGVIIATAIYLGWLLAKKRAAVYQIPQKLFDDPILIAPLVLAIAGARVYHVLDFWDFYSQNPGQILAIQNGGLGIFGGLIGVFLGFWLIAKIKNLSFLAILDLASPSILLGQAIGRIGNFINQEAFGPPTNLPWGIYISPENRPEQFINFTHFHPTFFYEAALDLIFFLMLLYLSRPSTVNRQPSTVGRGQLFALYLLFYSTGRFISEFWRIDTWMVDGFKVAHILSVIVFFFGLWLLRRLDTG